LPRARLGHSEVEQQWRLVARRRRLGDAFFASYFLWILASVGLDAGTVGRALERQTKRSGWPAFPWAESRAAADLELLTSS
jgi:hypothetical protein